MLKKLYQVNESAHETNFYASSFTQAANSYPNECVRFTLAVFLVFGVCKITVDEIVAMFYPSPIKRKTAYRQEAGVHAPNHWQTVGWHAITSRTVDWFIRVKNFVAKNCRILQTFWWV